MSTFLRFAALAAIFIVGWGSAARADDEVDPPSRVARLSFLRGDVSFSPAGESDWVTATINRPLINGDRLWTDRGARVELQLGSAAARLDEGTSLQLLNLDDRTVQVEVTEGTLNLRVRRLYQDQVYEIDTPTMAFTINRTGEYRIDVDPQGKHTTVAVWDGGGIAYGENANFPVREGEAIRFFDAELRDYEVFDIPQPDDFDRFAQARDERMDNAPSLRYVPEDMVGYSDLDEYGSWDSNVADYGAVWYPTHISSGWAPYRDGHWIWQEPWGWTWVDTAPWGFAPFHYGRWAYINTRWGWVPGPIRVRPVYSPALVGFVGGNHWGVSVGGGAPIGWFPLGPREVYCPPYRVSRNYFTNVNVTNTVINNTYITTVYNDYNSGRGLNNVNYAYRGNPAALSAVPGNVFVNARPVNGALIRMDRDMAGRGEIARSAGIAPIQRSVVGAAGPASVVPQRAVLDRQVVARRAPAPVIGSFASREQALQRNPGRPLEPSVALNANPAAGVNRGVGRADAPQRVRVVGNENPVNARAQAPVNNGRGPAPGRDTVDNGGSRSQPVLRTNPGDPNGRAPSVNPSRDVATPRGGVGDRAPNKGQGRGEIARPPARGDGLPSRTFRGNPQTAPTERTPAPSNTVRDNRPATLENNGRGQQPVLRSQPTPNVQREDRAPTRVERQPEIRRAEPVQNERPVQQRQERIERAPVLRQEAPPPQQRAAPVERQERQPRAPVEQIARPQREAAPQPQPQPQIQQRNAPPPQPQQGRAPAPQPAREGRGNKKKDDDRS